MKKIITISAILLLNCLFYLTGSAEEQLNKKAYSKAISGLYLRKAPSAKSEAIALIKYNTNLIILEYSKTEETISGIKAPWIKIKVEGQYQYEEIEGWVFGGFIDKKEPIKNSELINDEKYDLNTVVKLLDKQVYILLVVGESPITNLYFSGNKVIKDNSFIYNEDGSGGQGSFIENIEYKKDSVILKIKRELGEETVDDYKITQTDFFKCSIPKKTVLDIYNNRIKDQNQEVKCVLIK